MYRNCRQSQPPQLQMYCEINGILFAITPLPRQPGTAWPGSGSGQTLPQDFQTSMSERPPVPPVPPPPPPKCFPTTAPPVKCCGPAVEWVSTNINDAHMLSDRAVVAGFGKHNGSAFWVIRAKYAGDLIPGKLVVRDWTAYVGWDGREHNVHEFEVCCARPERIMWQEGRNGHVPPNAIVAGRTSNGEPLYVGRAFEEGSLTPGKVHPSYQELFLPFHGREASHTEYEVLCAVNVVHLCNCPFLSHNLQ